MKPEGHLEEVFSKTKVYSSRFADMSPDVSYIMVEMHIKVLPFIVVVNSFELL